MGLKILSCGAGMQSTALALMSCENARYGITHQQVPVYDAVVFCDLGCEAPWVYEQAAFIGRTCEESGIPYYKLDTDLYGDYQRNFGEKRVSSIPFWSIGPDGKKAKMRRHCTIDYKINTIHRFVRRELLGYAKNQRSRPEDIGTHEMHIGFSAEEQNRVFDSYHPFFVNRFPLVEMELRRPDNYRYILETWGLDTKASACCICPFHRNYFYDYLRRNYRDSYEAVVALDELLEEKQPDTKIRSRLFISRSRKRIRELAAEDCDDAEVFQYGDSFIWNGF